MFYEKSDKLSIFDIVSGGFARIPAGAGTAAAAAAALARCAALSTTSHPADPKRYSMWSRAEAQGDPALAAWLAVHFRFEDAFFSPTFAPHSPNFVVELRELRLAENGCRIQSGKLRMLLLQSAKLGQETKNWRKA